jgi:hypothetical protein
MTMMMTIARADGDSMARRKPSTENPNVSNERDRARGRNDNAFARLSGQFRRVNDMSEREMADIIAFLNALTTQISTGRSPHACRAACRRRTHPLRRFTLTRSCL